MVRIARSVLVAAVFSALVRLVPPIGAPLLPSGIRTRAMMGSDWIEKFVQVLVAALGMSAVLDVWDITVGAALTVTFSPASGPLRAGIFRP